MPKLYSRHLRHSDFKRVRHSKNMLAWLTEQGTRLGKTPEQVFELLKSNTAEQILALPDASSDSGN
ncbi:hypothetical protein pVco14_014 [Vibrio phage pVco-14]|nr:hypothetical protein pVco14_014 [Vibrio phage pVco-14]